MAPLPAPGLLDDLIGEILLRLPPEDPECLIRASVVCKPWRRLILSDPGFPRRYREFHGSPPMLGFFHNEFDSASRFFPSFIPVKEASPILVNYKAGLIDCWIIDCRHSRVLLVNYKTGLIIWDPITNSQQNIGQPKISEESTLYDYTAAVLCAVDSCDHLGCCSGPSFVVIVELEAGSSASAIVYSTETGAWNSAVSSVHLVDPFTYRTRKMIGSSLLVEDTVYFILEEGRTILAYDLAACGLSQMSPPPLPVGNMVLMKAEGGGLGACGVEGHSLNLWAWRTGHGGIWEWKKGRVILLDIGELSIKPDVVDFAEGAGSIFVRTNDGFFAVELQSGQARKIGKGGNFKDIFPFMSFYTPEIMYPSTTRLQAPMVMEEAVVSIL